jgi:hypothetical protein
VNLFQVDSGSADVYGVSYVAVNKAGHEDLLTCGAIKWPEHSAVFKNRIFFTRCNIYLLLFDDAMNC